MTRLVIPALALLLSAACNTSAQTAPAGQTPQTGAPGAASTPAGSSPATPSPATTQTGATPAATTQPQGSATQATPSGTPRRTPRPTASRPNSTAPIANSRTFIHGNNAQTDKPTGDHPLLDMTAVGNPLGIRSGTPIRVQLQKPADSGHLRNGDTLPAILSEPVGGLSKGTAVQLTVVQASQAGALTSAGELSIQVTRIGNYDVLSLIVTALGKEGKKELPDAAPTIGTEATFAAGQDLSFPAA